jgi:hypothetical protein
MRAFTCSVCGRGIYFESTSCVHCRSELGFVPADRDLAAFAPIGLTGAAVPLGTGGPSMRPCQNRVVVGCNWMVPDDGSTVWCRSCATTRTRPADGDLVGIARWRIAEAAKRRLLFQLFELGLPIDAVPATRLQPLAFDMLHSPGAVTIGHRNGLITLDLAESDPAHREQVRGHLGEPYRTVLGHLRHEIGHYYWPLVAAQPAALERFRAEFGDERTDYEQALERHYRVGPPAGWEQRHVSAYASAHPWEDWAESVAHYLHIRDTLQTAGAFGLHVDGDPVELAPGTFAEILAAWLPLTFALNELNRSMGLGDLYPFVLARPVVDKLTTIHELVRQQFP